jgi:hypothetical protein
MTDAVDCPQRDFLHECFEIREVFDEHSAVSATPQVPNIHLFWKIRPLEHFNSARGMNAYNSHYPGTRAGSEAEAHGTRFQPHRNVMIQGSLYLESRIIYTALVASVSTDMQIDHWNWNPRYNAPSNLRALTPKQNIWNKGLKRTNTSGFLGVSWYKKYGKWRAQGMDNDDFHKNIGYFTYKIEAALAYDAYIRPIRGSFGIYNFPKEGERGLPQLLLAA